MVRGSVRKELKRSGCYGWSTAGWVGDGPARLSRAWLGALGKVPRAHEQTERLADREKESLQKLRLVLAFLAPGMGRGGTGSQKKVRCEGVVHLGVGRLTRWAPSPLLYVTALPAH